MSSDGLSRIFPFSAPLFSNAELPAEPSRARPTH
jgi:hypothetical protein